MSTLSDYIEVEVWCSIGLVGCKLKQRVTVDREEWEEMSDMDKEDYCRDIAFESFEWGWNEVSE